MLMGNENRFFSGSYAFLGKLKATPSYSNQRCIVKRYMADKERWHIRLWDERFNGKEVLVQENNLTFDCYAAPPLLLPSLPSGLRVASVGAAGDALISAKDVEEGAILLKESPMMVVSNKDVLASRWNLYFATENEQGPRAPVLAAFQELCTGGMAESFMSDARALFKTMLAGAGKGAEKHLESLGGKGFLEAEVRRIASVLARWQSNCHAFTVAGGTVQQSALFRFTSKANHSCEANCTTMIDEHTGCMILKAKRNIQKGEQITNNYMGSDPEFLALPVEERRRRLAARGFDCVCSRCVREAGASPAKSTAAPGIRGLPVIDCGVKATLELKAVGADEGQTLLDGGATAAAATSASDVSTTCSESDGEKVGLPCCSCQGNLPKANFTKKQLQKGTQRRCKGCTNQQN